MSKHTPFWRGLRPEFVFVVLAFVFGAIAYCLLPPVAGHDEHTHVARVDQLANLNLFSESVKSKGVKNKEKVLWGGEIDAALSTYASTYVTDTHEGLKTYDEPITLESAGIWEAYGSMGKSPVVFSNTAVNTPVVYFPHVIGFALARLFTSSVFYLYMAMRAFGFLFFVAAGYFAIRKTPLGKWALVVFLLLPNVFIPALCVSADIVTNGVVLMFAASLMALISHGCSGRTKKSDWVYVSVLTMLLALVKSTYIPLAALVALVPLVCPKLRTKYVALWVVALLATSALLFLAWYWMVVRHINVGVMWGLPWKVLPSDQVSYIRAHPLSFFALVPPTVSIPSILQLLNESFFAGYRGGLVSWSLPLWLYALPLVGSLLLIDSREDRTSEFIAVLPKVMISFLAASAVCYVTICLAMYVTFTGVGASRIEGLQARYYVPIAVLLVMVASMFVAWASRLRLLRVGRIGAGVASLSSWVCRHNLMLKVVVTGALVLLSVMSICYLYQAYAR